MNRQKWDDYFLLIASAVAMRATCPRALVGAVIVRDHRIVATGFNGSASGEPHCIDTNVGCLMKDGHCQRAIHAETNAVAQCARFGIPTDGTTLYYWDSQCRPYDACVKCTQIMKAAGIVRIVGR